MKVLVVGSGAIGLQTAIELLKRNVQVMIRSSQSPIHPATCSSGAGGLWMPYKCDDPRVDRWAMDTLNDLLPLSKRPFLSSTSELKETSDEDTAIEIVPSLCFYDKDVQEFESSPSLLPDWTTDTRINFELLSIPDLMEKNKDMKLRIPSEEQLVNDGYKSAWLFYPPIIDTAKMLEKMVAEIKSHPLMQSEDSFQTTKTYTDMDDIITDAKALGCSSIINCTGMGARKLLSKPTASTSKEETSLIGGRGILLHYNRQSCQRISDIPSSNIHDATIFLEEPVGTDTEPCYLIPRGDLLVVGGSYFKGDTFEGIRDSEMKRLLKNAKLLGIDTEKEEPCSEWTGFRPCRSIVRLEMDEDILKKDGEMKVIHSYGHGGAGWTVYTAVARSTVELLMGDGSDQGDERSIKRQKTEEST